MQKNKLETILNLFEGKEIMSLFYKIKYYYRQISHILKFY